MQKRIDICHMLSMEIQEQNEKVSQTMELREDCQIKNQKLLEKTREKEMSLNEERDALRLMENEVLKSKQGLSGKEDQFYSLLVEERLIDEQLEATHKRIESLKDKRRLTQLNNETTQEAITYRIDQTDQYQSNFSVKLSMTEIQEQ